MQIDTFAMIHPTLGECQADATQLENLTAAGWSRKAAPQGAQGDAAKNGDQKPAAPQGAQGDAAKK